jgi:hypothetical protein
MLKDGPFMDAGMFPPALILEPGSMHVNQATMAQSAALNSVAALD